MMTCASCNGSGLCDIDGSPCGACNGSGEIEEYDPALDEMARLRAELAEARAKLAETRAKLEQAKRAALVGWFAVCAANTWGFDSTTDHVAALIRHGRDLLGEGQS